MSDFNHDPSITETAAWLETLQRDGQRVMINLKTDEAMQTASHYYGMVERVAVEVPEPFVDIQAEKLIIEYFSQAHRNAGELFSTLRAARETVTPTKSATEALIHDLALRAAIDKELDVKQDAHTIELTSTPQRITLGAIHSTFGIGRP